MSYPTDPNKQPMTLDDLAGCLHSYAQAPFVSVEAEKAALIESMRPYMAKKFRLGTGPYQSLTDLSELTAEFKNPPLKEHE